MSQTQNPLRLALSDVLPDAGFVRDRSPGNWFRSSDEVVQVVNLQKSRWGTQYYINYGIWFRSLGKTTRPREAQCHIRLRLSDVRPRLKGKLERLLDLDPEVPDRRKALAKMLAKYLVPLADSCLTVKGIKKLLATGRLPEHHLTLDARRALGLVS